MSIMRLIPDTGEDRAAEQIAGRVRAIMAEHKLSSARVAEAIGMSQPAFSRRYSGELDWSIDQLASTDVVTGMNPKECVHVACAGWEECRFKPDPIGPELPPLILDCEGRWWGNLRPGGRVWWYGSSMMVTWSTLGRMSRGEPQMPYDERGDFPWGPWIAADYGDSPAAEREFEARQALVTA